MSSGGWRRAFFDRQDAYSLICAACALLFCATAAMHLVWSPIEATDRGLLISMVVLAAILAAAPLLMGRRYPRRCSGVAAGIGLVGIYAAVLFGSSPPLVMNAVLLAPVISLISGWLFHTQNARAAVLVGNGVMILFLAYRSLQVDWQVLSVTTALYIALITGFLFEAGVYLQKSTNRRVKHDSLTGALNRFGLWEEGAHELERADRAGTTITLVMVDLDGFKALNDSQGHLAGDLELIRVVESWRARIRPYDLIVRLGGDEFVLLFPGISGDNAAGIVQRLRVGASVPWSAGIAERAPGESLESLLQRADAELLGARARRK